MITYIVHEEKYEKYLYSNIPKLRNRFKYQHMSDKVGHRYMQIKSQ